MIYYCSDISIIEELSESVKIKEITRNNIGLFTCDILECETIEKAFEWCFIRSIAPNVIGNKLEYYIINKYDMTKISPSLNGGDAYWMDIPIEIKCSSGRDNKFNFVQIRKPIHHLFICYTIDEVYCFLVPPCCIEDFIIRYGTYAHGTFSQYGKINELNENREYALRFKYNGKLWNELLQYRMAL
jgi:hypothetical protein